MITTKSSREIELMRIAGKIVALAHEEVRKNIRVGITTKELDQIAYDVIIQNDAVPSFKGYNGFPASICASINDVLVHGIPSNVALKDGDIISVDIGAIYQGYHGDSAKTHTVGKVSEEARNLIDVTKQSLFEGLKYAKAGNRLGDISHAIQTFVESRGYSLPIEYSGHGIGTSMHEDPMIPNVGKPNTGVKLKPGMTLAIEPMVHIGKPHTRVMGDGWTVKTLDGSLAAHYEHTIVITDSGYEILTIIANEEGHDGKR